MNILLTGSTGFIGQRLLAELSKEHLMLLFRRGENVQSYKDRKIDVIINCAAELDNEDKMVESNLSLVEQLLRLARHNNSRVIQIGSSSETGPMEGARSPDSKCNPSNLYETTKFAATNLCQNYVRGYGLDVCVARPFSVYGPYDRPRKMIPSLFRALKEDKEFHCYPGGHDWIYIDDFIAGILAILNCRGSKDVVAGHIYHFGTGMSTSNEEVIKTLEKISGKQMKIVYHQEKYRDYDVMDWRADWSKSYSKLLWSPKYMLEDGLRKIYETI